MKIELIIDTSDMETVLKQLAAKGIKPEPFKDFSRGIANTSRELPMVDTSDFHLYPSFSASIKVTTDRVSEKYQLRRNLECVRESVERQVGRVIQSHSRNE